MSPYFSCKNRQQHLSWSSVCDGHQDCFDGSDEENCFCQDDIYQCLKGNNVSCRFACQTYGRVTCLTYQNTRACEQFFRDMEINSNNHHHQLSYAPFDQFDALRYSAVLALTILLCATILSIVIYVIRKHPSIFVFSTCTKRPTNRFSALQQTSTANISVTRYTSAPDVHQLPTHPYSTDFYQPPPYSGQSHSDSSYYETIKTPNTSSTKMTLSDQFMQSHCV